MEPAIRLKPGCSKSDIRKKVWDYIEKNDLADFPRPVHNRIPNFKGASHACEKLLSLPEFHDARTVKIDPDSPHKNARFLTLDAHKILLVPTPRLRKGLFNRITPPARAGKEMLKMCSTPQGVKEHSVPVSLDDRISVDLVVVGSVAVSEKGWRIGKGEGFADLEHAMMVAMEAVTEDTVVVTIVHDCQVLDFPEDLLGDHDLTVDYILTPTRVIKTDCKRPKPEGIIWSKVTWEMMKKIPILKKLQAIEKEAGKNVFIKKDHDQELHTRLEACDLGDVHTLYIGNIPPTTTINEFKDILQEKGAPPLRLKWQIDHQRAFLDYMDVAQARQALSSLQGLTIRGNSLWVNLARAKVSNSKTQ
ncbi:methenyltetrahydrofolate synthase domain-containing isoform X2 [Pelobates cultripes]|uniref:Methenyltetrahydrofolate synthase domain-containing protein n=1 Tax=Pelobates cultripes TaxID=61616 RepID=A0AAD1WVK5_PELCU|nr:methenyltetrahydrofolate synthase domain-containing isoform X2 [Pelobates cultripes]